MDDRHTKIRFAYTALRVEDLDRSVKFYTEILRMKEVVRKAVKETNGEMCVLKAGDHDLELNKYSDSTAEKGNNLDHLAFEVEPLAAFHALVEELKSRGIETQEYLETKNWIRFFIADPDDNWIEIYTRKKAMG